jgi:hypothetical protein
MRRRLLAARSSAVLPCISVAGFVFEAQKKAVLVEGAVP